jgi:hypothetical protein
MPTTAAAANLTALRSAIEPLLSGHEGRRRPVRWLSVISLAGMLLASAATAETAPAPVFAGIAAAFEASEASQLASVVHPDGLRVTGAGDRPSHYSPSQAVYFFRNLFEGQRTLLFSFLKSQDDARGDHARGLATWKRRRLDSERVIEVQIVVVLARDGDHWRLAELNIIR